jgi:cell division protein FtsN
MAPQKLGEFEFRLSIFGLTVFIFGISLLLLSSFIFGVVVGKNIESYPEKIARGIPSAIKEKITNNDDERREMTEDGKEEFALTFYDTLPKKSGGEEVAARKMSDPAAPAVAIGEKPEISGSYIIKVASFKDRQRMESLRKRLSAMGYSPKIDEISLTSSGNWFRVRLEGFPTFEEAQRVSTIIEIKIPGLKCLVTND